MVTVGVVHQSIWEMSVLKDATQSTRFFLKSHAWGSRVKLSVLCILASVVLIFTDPLSAQELPRMAVLDLDARGASKIEAEAIAEEIRRIFVKTGKYSVIDRTLTNKIMREWETQQSGITDENKAVEIGKLFNVKILVTGKLHKFPGGGWQVSIVMLDAKTGETKKAETVRYKGEFFSLLDEKIPTIGRNLAGSGTTIEASTPTPPPAAPPKAEPVATVVEKMKIVLFPSKFEGEYASDGDKYNSNAVNRLYNQLLLSENFEIKESFIKSGLSGSKNNSKLDYVESNAWEGFFSSVPNEEFIFQMGKDLKADLVFLYKVSLPGGCEGMITSYLFEIKNFKWEKIEDRWVCRRKGGISWIGKVPIGFKDLLDQSISGS